MNRRDFITVADVNDAVETRVHIDLTTIKEQDQWPYSRSFDTLREAELDRVTAAAEVRLKLVDLAAEKARLEGDIAHERRFHARSPPHMAEVKRTLRKIEKIDKLVDKRTAFLQGNVVHLLTTTEIREKIQREVEGQCKAKAYAGIPLTAAENAMEAKFVHGREYLVDIDELYRFEDSRAGFELIRRDLHQPTELRAHMAAVSIF